MMLKEHIKSMTIVTIFVICVLYVHAMLAYDIQYNPILWEVSMLQEKSIVALGFIAVGYIIDMFFRYHATIEK